MLTVTRPWHVFWPVYCGAVGTCRQKACYYSLVARPIKFPGAIFSICFFFVHIVFPRTITLAYIFLYRTSAHYKSDALLRTTHAGCSTPAFVHVTLVNRNTKPPPPQSGLHQQCRGRFFYMYGRITPRWVSTGLIYQVKSIQHIFILYHGP